MANLVILRDPDPFRRAEFLARARPAVVPFAGLVQGEAGFGDMVVAWAASPRAPVSSCNRADALALIWGDARLAGEERRLEASDLLAHWSSPVPEQTFALDGYHASLVCREELGITIGADLLGLFPIYYWSEGGVLLAGSSPELFRLHPAFVPRVSPSGLAGILLTNGLVGGQAMLEGVRRLSPGCLLSVPLGQAPREVEQYRPPLGDGYGDLKFSDQVEALAEALIEAVRRCLPGDASGSLLLSGGLDSRTLAGVLMELERRPDALTRGRAPDIELACATAVAQAAGFRHHVDDAPLGDVASGARLKAKWEHLGGGFFGGTRWGPESILARLPLPLLSGLLLDDVIGPKGVASLGPEGRRDAIIDARCARAISWGLAPDVVDALLGSEGLAGTVLDQVKQAMSGHHTKLSKSVWANQLRTRSRFHVGGNLWVQSFSCWPATPVLDQRLLSVVAGMPLSTLGERRAEIELVCRRFPKLAALPLDRNSWEQAPLRPRLRYLIVDAVRTRLDLGRLRTGGEERRYYYRIADFNNPAWRAVRRAAEERRAAAETFLDAAVLRRTLPAPSVQAQSSNGIADTSGLRLLTGFLLWAGEYSS